MRDKYIVREVDAGLSDFTLGIRYDKDHRLLRIGGPKRFEDAALEILASCFFSNGGQPPGMRDKRIAWDVDVVPRVWRRGVRLLKERYRVTKVERFGRLMY